METICKVTYPFCSNLPPMPLLLHTQGLMSSLSDYFCTTYLEFIQSYFQFVVYCHGYNLFCYSSWFTTSSAVLWISCLWCIIQPLPSIILKLSSHPYNFLCHSNDLVSHVQKTFCDPHKIFCYPYYYANELPVFLTMSSVFVAESVSNDRY